MSNYLAPSGFPEYLPPVQAQFEWLKQKIADSFAAYGFVYLQTPAVEYLNTLASEGDISKEIYALTRAASEGESGSLDRGLRFDLTTPFARYVANHQGHLTFPFKRYQIDRVWRGERPQKGRYRELYQADVDIVDRDELNPTFDGEILSIIASTLDSLDLFDFTIRVNDRHFLQTYIARYGVVESHLPAAFNIIDKLAKVPAEVSRARLVEECALSQEQAAELLEGLSQPIPLEDYAELSSDFAPLATAVQALDLQRGRIVIDLSIVRGLDYYTGFVYETTVNGHEGFGSISSGGRYANLAARFSKNSFPGVGGSIGLSRLFFVLQETNLLPALPAPAGVYVLALEESQQAANQALAATLRVAGIRAEVAPAVTKFGKQLKYATAKDYPYAAICELDGTITLKDLSAREQTTGLSATEVLAKINT